MYTIGTLLPKGKNIKERLENWSQMKTEIGKQPSPIGNMEVEVITDAIRKSLDLRKILTPSFDKRLAALGYHLKNKKYCYSLKARGEIESCHDPKARARPTPMR